MKRFIRNITPLCLIMIAMVGMLGSASAHSVQLAYCGNCGGNLRLWVEHWHSTANVTSTTMTISLTVGATTTTTTGSPLTNLQNTTLNNLPGCTTPPVVFASCPTRMNTYLDWVNYDFLAVPCGVQVSITVVSGNSAFTADGCGMMPASTGSFVIPCVQSAGASYIPPLNVCLGDSMQFIDLSSPAGLITWHWDFGDGNTSTLQHPAHTYALPGNYNVKLTVTTTLNCPDDTTITVTVEDYPTPNFSSNIGCSGYATSFSDLSTITFGSITNWQWDFGDGNTSTLQNPSNVYALGGPYTVSLIATSSGGCVDSISQIINVPHQPVADLSLDTFICFGQAAAFTDLSTMPPGGVFSNMHWDFGVPNPVTNDTSNLGSPTYNFPIPGTFQVSLVATGVGGCTDTAWGTILVENSPATEFSVTHECHGTASQFGDLSTTPIGSVGQWSWDFGDGAGTSTVQNPSYTYTAPGTYTVKLVASISGACPDSVERKVHVHHMPVPEFVASKLDGCHPLCVDLTNTSTIGGGNILFNSWLLGDGNSATTQDVTGKCYMNNGQTVRNYDVQLTVTSDSGCVAVESKGGYLTVYPIPIASFTYMPEIVNIDAAEYDFDNNSSGGGTSFWDFGDGLNSTARNPSHLYADTGWFSVWLYEENQYGCRDSTWQYVRVDPVFSVHIPNAFTAGSDGLNDRWKPKVFGVKEITTTVFDRWGGKIWIGEGLDSSWDGTKKGDPVETETYVYKVILQTALGDWREYRGKVTLLR